MISVRSPSAFLAYAASVGLDVKLWASQVSDDLCHFSFFWARLAITNNRAGAATAAAVILAPLSRTARKYAEDGSHGHCGERLLTAL